MSKIVRRKLKLISLASLLLSTLMVANIQFAAAQEYKKITRLGTSEAMCPGGVQSAADLQEYFANNPAAVRAVLASSGWGGSADDLFAAVAAGEFSERAYPVGTKLAWMGANKKKQGFMAMPYREWAGSKSFAGYEVNVSSGCQVYQIVIPKECCNVSLMGVTPDDSTECTAPVAAVATSEEAPAPAAVDANKELLGLVPFFGAFLGTETRPRFEPAWEMDKRDSSGIAGVRAGMMKGLNAKTSVFGQLSYYDRSGINEPNIYPENNFAFDIGLERRLSEKAFIGGGIGLWNFDDSDFSDASVFGHVGGDIGASNFQWILEGRVFDSDSEILDSISDNKMFSVGVRYLVK